MITQKHQMEITGVLMTPITVGAPAFVAIDGNVIRTSTVVAIHTQARTLTVFETRNSIYTLRLTDTATRRPNEGQVRQNV